MRCGKCGASFGVTGYGREKKYAYYNCITYSKKGKSVCPGKSLRADKLDAEVIGRLKKLVFSEESMKKFVDDINETAQSLRSDYGKKITDLKKKATDLQMRLMRQYEAIENGGIDFTLVSERLRELKTQKDTLQEEIDYYERLNSQNQPVSISRATVERYRTEMESIFMGTNVQEQREFLKKFIEKIFVKDEGIEIMYYAPTL